MALTARFVLLVLVFVGLARLASADVVTDWNERAVAAGYKAGLVPPKQSRILAIVHVAMFDAVNSIAKRCTPHLVQLPAQPDTSPEAAAAAAAHYVLVRIHPDQAAELDAAFEASLAAVPEGPSRARGVELGERAAAAILDARKEDGADAPNTYRPFTVAGTYVPTVFPLVPTWGSVKPFALETGSQFRPAAPYALTSAQWTTDYNEVKRFGAKTGSERSAEQTVIARFWEFTGPGTYNPLVRQLSAAKALDLFENARLFAHVAMAGADAMIAVMDAKYTYRFWRPVTAIRNADLDSNDATERDPAWEPLIPTPMHPEYPCAHCIVQSAVATVLTSAFGDAIPTVAMTSPTAPGVTRRFVRLSDYVSEVINARVYDGVHYRTSGEVGAAMGRQIGTYVTEHSLRPLARSTAR
jgi:PAP2 superfamily